MWHWSNLSKVEQVLREQNKSRISSERERGKLKPHDLNTWGVWVSVVIYSGSAWVVKGEEWMRTNKPDGSKMWMIGLNVTLHDNSTVSTWIQLKIHFCFIHSSIFQLFNALCIVAIREHAWKNNRYNVRRYHLPGGAKLRRTRRGEPSGCVSANIAHIHWLWGKKRNVRIIHFTANWNASGGIRNGLGQICSWIRRWPTDACFIPAGVLGIKGSDVKKKGPDLRWFSILRKKTRFLCLGFDLFRHQNWFLINNLLFHLLMQILVWSFLIWIKTRTISEAWAFSP